MIKCIVTDNNGVFMSIKRAIKKFAEKIFQSKWYPNKKILLESVPDMSCQTYPVFQKMLENHLNDEYKIIWLVSDKNDFKDIHIKNVKFMNFYPKTRFEKIQRMYTLCTSRAMLYANRYIGKVFEKQLFVYLQHGTSLKSRLKHCREDENNESDMCICLAPFFVKYDSLESGGISEEKFVITGYPRNDFLFENDKNYIKKIYPNKKYNKVILWMPTFRKADNSDRVDSTFDFPLEIPCLYTEEDCKKLNEVLIENNILLILKPHPAQKLTLLKKLGLSNFVVLYNDTISNANLQLYQFIGATDALITDYSSVYYDYLLTGNNIGLTVDDFDTYSKETGFVFENVFDYIIGEHILNVDDFISFVKDVANGEDKLKSKRDEMCKLFNENRDNKSSQRVYDCIIEQIKRRY